MSALPLFDTPDITRNRHRGNSESRAAAKKVHRGKSEMYRSILFWLSTVSHTAKEFTDQFGIPLNRHSGRWSELKAGGLIAKTTMRRDGSAVMQITNEGIRALISCQLGLARIEHEGNAAKVVKI